MKKNGFTIIEIVIAITISVLILGGVLAFLQRLQNDILTSEQSTRVYTSLSDFMGTMKNFSKLYESGIVLVDSTGYDTVLLMRPDKASGVLIGVVEQGNSGSTSRLDPIVNKGIYGKKIIAYQRLTASGVASVLTSSGNAYNVDFFDEGLFKELPVTDFSVSAYNSGEILEYKINVEVPYYQSLSGKVRSTLSTDVTNLPFTLDF